MKPSKPSNIIKSQEKEPPFDGVLQCEREMNEGKEYLNCKIVSGEDMNNILSDQDPNNMVYDVYEQDYIELLQRSAGNKNPITNMLGILIVVSLVGGLGYGIAYLSVYILYDFIINPNFGETDNWIRMVISFTLLLVLLIGFILLGYWFLKKEQSVVSKNSTKKYPIMVHNKPNKNLEK
jgi:flagellar basal body-associated protein FliL